MRRDAVDFDVWERCDPFENLDSGQFRNAHAPHAGVDLEIDENGRVSCDLRKIFYFVERRNGRNESALHDCRSFFGKGRAKDDNRMREFVSQRDRLLQVRDAE